MSARKLRCLPKLFFIRDLHTSLFHEVSLVNSKIPTGLYDRVRTRSCIISIKYREYCRMTYIWRHVAYLGFSIYFRQAKRFKMVNYMIRDTLIEHTDNYPTQKSSLITKSLLMLRYQCKFSY